MLRDLAQLSGTTSVGVAYSVLLLDNTQLYGMSGRVNPTAPVTLRGGNITILGRAQSDTTDSMGVVTLAEGMSTITATSGGTGINSVTLTLAGLSQSSIDATVTMTGTGGGALLGTIGSNPRILANAINGISTALDSSTTPLTLNALTNNIIGGWAVTGTEFVSYNPTYGFGALNQIGFAGYDVNLTTAAQLTVNSIDIPTQNVRATIAVNVPTGRVGGEYAEPARRRPDVQYEHRGAQSRQRRFDRRRGEYIRRKCRFRLDHRGR